MTYEEAIAYIHGMYWRGSKLGLSRTVELCGLLGNPQKQLKFIHVAGTNGKGSTCAMLSRVLCAAGYKTGLFVSPYVDRFNERIQLNNTPIPDDDLAAIVTEIAPVVDSMENPATEFEVITAAAFLYYARQNCDYVVLEVGLGGELDSTNVIDTPLLAIITAIDFDHMHILGDTIREIASAKAGIIKDGGTVLFYGEHKDALPVIRAACRKHRAKLSVVDRSTLREGMYDLHGQTFSYKDYTDLRLGLLGRYQLSNAATVIDAVQLLRKKGVTISDEALRIGLKDTVWPARFELLREDPPFFVDGGHNPHGVRGTVETFQRLFPDQKAKIVMGMMADKDVSQSIELLLPIASRFFTVTPDNPRAMPAGELAALIEGFGAQATAFNTVYDAIETAARGTEPTLAVGSLYMAGEVHEAFRKWSDRGSFDA
jgi:dihydrofolate synthase/folylpolyglutamate synthase